MSDWFLIYDKTPLSAAENMASDEYLFNLCHEKKAGFFRLYSWSTPTFSFGASQKIKKVINLEYLNNNGFSYVRRITGGKVVLHNDEITYSVISSEDFFYREHDLFQSYLLIANILLETLKMLGLEAVLSAGSTAKLSKSNNPCFSFPTSNEIEVSGKKIIGSAQKRDNKALLQHGSIPITMDYEMYAGGTFSQAESIEKNMTTLSRVCEKSPGELITALIESFQRFVGCKLKEFDFGKNQKNEIVRLEKKYTSQDWNFSR